jgi:hypothetical protein
MLRHRSVSIRRQFEKRANRVAALCGICILAVLLLYDMSLWTVLVPVWILSWITLHIVVQKFATDAETLNQCASQPDYLIFRKKSHIDDI